MASMSLGLRERVGNLPPIKTGGVRFSGYIVFSVGEPRRRGAVDTLVERFLLLPRYFHHHVDRTKIAREISVKCGGSFYFPVDWAWTVRAF